MGFFRNLNFPRGVILISLVTSAAFGWFLYQKTERLDEIKRELTLVEGLVKDIQTRGIELNNLQKSASGELLKGEDYDAETYIREIAADGNVNIGQLLINPSKKSPSKQFEDHIYKISPSNKKQRHSKSQIGNFLYKLEADSRRVKVTSLQISPLDKTKPGEIGNDVWSFEASITTRTKTEG